MDVNDNSPSFVSIHSTQLKAVENWGEGRLLSILTAEDEDEGENGRVMYRLTQSSPCEYSRRQSQIEERHFRYFNR